MGKVSRPLIIVGALLGVLFVAGGGFFYLQQRKSKREVRPEREILAEAPEAPSEIIYETFQTADANFSFEYPAAWTRTEIKNLEEVLPGEFVDKYQLTMPLILSNPDGAQASLSIYRFEKGMDLEAVMDALEAELAGMGQPYNETNRQMVGDSLVVDSTVDAGQGVTVRVRDILFLVPGETQDTIYNISFSAHQESWGDYETIFNHIQNSAKLPP